MPEVDRNYSNQEFANRYREEATTPLELKCIERLDYEIDEVAIEVSNLSDLDKVLGKLTELMDEADSFLQNTIELIEKEKIEVIPDDFYKSILDLQSKVDEDMKKLRDERENLTYHLEE